MPRLTPLANRQSAPASQDICPRTGSDRRDVQAASLCGKQPSVPMRFFLQYQSLRGE
jgi:hypothetical protein